MKTLLVVTAFLCMTMIGYAAGSMQQSYDRGFKNGQQEALATANDLLSQRGYKFWFRYTDTVYELVIPQGSLKANGRRKDHITTTE